MFHTISDLVSVTAVSCGSPGLPAFSSASSRSYWYPNTITYTCRQGFNLVGSPKLACLVDGSWNATLPSCVPVKCPRILNIPWMSFHGSNFSYGSCIELKCAHGFNLVGEPVLECLWQGNWSHKVPHCQPVQCSSPSVPRNARLVLVNNSYRGSAHFKCFAGYEFAATDGSVAYCMANRTWSRIPDELCKSRCAEITRSFVQLGILVFITILIIRNKPHK